MFWLKRHLKLRKIENKRARERMLEISRPETLMVGALRLELWSRFILMVVKEHHGSSSNEPSASLSRFLTSLTPLR